MLNHVLQVLKNRCLLDFDQPVILGVSGGSDSLCLLHLMHEAKIPVIVAHYNHHIRPEADWEASRVEGWVQELGLPFVYGERKLKAGHAEYISEEIARQMRYEFLFDTAIQEKGQAVAVAHNADDQVETILLHLLRGSGLSGLTGMSYYALPNAWSKTIPLIRPLLSTWRQEITEFIEAHHLSPNVDGSNYDITLMRNRIRQVLIPDLQTYSPQIKRLLFRMSEILKDEEKFIDNYVDEAWQDCFVFNDDHRVEISAGSFFNQKINIQRRIVRKAIRLLLPSLRDIDSEMVERLILLSGRNKNYQDAVLGEGLYFSKINDRLMITQGEYQVTDDFPQIAVESVISVPVPGTVKILPYWTLETRVVALDDHLKKEIESNSNPYQAWLDIDKVDLPLQMRARRSGDRFCPLGMEGHSIKLSDFMVNERIPRYLRNSLPLILSGKTIAWVIPYRIAHQFRVTAQTKRVVWLSLSIKDSSLPGGLISC